MDLHATGGFHLQTVASGSLTAVPPSTDQRFSSAGGTPLHRGDWIKIDCLVVKILSLLPAVARVLCGGVSREWRGLVDDPLVWESVCFHPRARPAASCCNGSILSALEATQGQMDVFSSQLPYKCHQNRVTYVGDGLKIFSWVTSRVV